VSAWRTLLHRIGYLSGPRRFDRQLDAELRFHIDSRADELERQGYSRSAAESRALAEFGSRTRVAEDARAAWQFRWFEDLTTDIAYALRSFRRYRAFAATAVGCLALGIAANALIFSLVNAALLQPLPYPEADRIVMVRFTPPQQPDQKLGTNAGGYFFIREHSRVFERMGVLRITGFSVAVGESDSVAREWLQGGTGDRSLVPS
jgi:hypothetical protein